MVDTKPFKTKLCVLYQRGRCTRQTCTFAHGDSELRRFSGSFSGRTISVLCCVTHIIQWEDRRNNRSNDLRNRLDRRRSSPHRHSPGRDARYWHGHERFSPPRPVKRRNHRTHEHMDDQSDYSGSFKEEQGKDKKFTSLEDELKQVQYEVDVLLDQRGQLEIELEERIQEADSLSSRINDLEAELTEEKEKTRRVNSKIKKLIRAHAHRTRLQDELRGSQVQFEKLVEDLGLDAKQLLVSEDKSNIDIISDEEVPELKKGSTFPVKKHLDSSMKASEGSKFDKLASSHGIRVGGSAQRSSHVRPDNNKEGEVGSKRKDIARLQSSESKSKRQRDASKGSASNKPRALEPSILAPPTSMAAHAADDFAEQMDSDEKTEMVETPATVENGLPIPLPPQPSVSENNYVQYEGDDENVENVDVDGLEEDLEEVDIV